MYISTIKGEFTLNIQDYFSSHITTGRIAEIASAACNYYNCSTAKELSPNQKLESLCTALAIDRLSLDEIIANSPEVKRTVKGHAFEIIFEKMLINNAISCTDIGGDGDTDLIVNNITLQLKTPYVNGCSENTVSYKTHKTHGAKSELESFDYYHKVSDFADYLVGLVSYEPFQVVIIPKNELPRVPDHDEYIQSPMYINIENGQYINDFNKLGISKSLVFPRSITTLDSNEILPLSASAMDVRSEYILEAIFRIENFRIWDMNMRGFIRERSLSNLFSQNSITVFPPTITGLDRPEKSDLVLQNKENNYIRFQVKGLTFSGCRFDGQNSRIDCETQLSRGRVNDHPTQSRLYKISDFEYVIMAMDPPYTNKYNLEYFGTPNYKWSYYCVPVAALSTHPTYTTRIASHQYIMFKDLLQYKINPEWLTQWN